MKKIIVGIIAVILIVVGISYFGKNSSQPSSKEPIKIGVILPLTDASADAGEYIKNGLDIAEREINGSPKNKYKISLIFEDSQYKGDKAASAAQKLINIDGVKYIIGEYGSSQTLAIAPIAEANKVILISPASQTEKITTAGDYIFRTQITTKQDADFFARPVFEKIGNEKLAILSINTDYGISYINNFSDAYNKLGGVIGFVEKLDIKNTDFRISLLKAKENGARAILLVGNRQFNGLVLKQKNELGLEFRFFASSVTEGKELIDVAGTLAEGLLYPYPFDDESDVSSQKSFQDKYIKEYREKSEMLGANGYDSLILLSNCFEKVGNNAKKVKQCLYLVKNYQGASGILSFDENGDVSKPFILKTVKNARFVKYEE